jgi:hypothetical protein
MTCDERGRFMADESDSQSSDGTTSPRQATDPPMPKLSLRAVESAGFLAIVTGILYFIGYSYYAGFFGRLLFPNPYPELSTSDYFIRAFTNFTGMFSLLLWLDNISNQFHVPTTYGDVPVARDGPNPLYGEATSDDPGAWLADAVRGAEALPPSPGRHRQYRTLVSDRTARDLPDAAGSRWIGGGVEIARASVLAGPLCMERRATQASPLQL